MVEICSRPKLATSDDITWFCNPEILNVNFVCPENLNSHNRVRLSGGNAAFSNEFNVYKPINNFSRPKKVIPRWKLYRPAEVDGVWAQFNCF